MSLGFPRGPGSNVDNPLYSQRRGKALSWQGAVLRNVMQTISRGIKDDQAVGHEAGKPAKLRWEEPNRKRWSVESKLVQRKIQKQNVTARDMMLTSHICEIYLSAFYLN